MLQPYYILSASLLVRRGGPRVEFKVIGNWWSINNILEVTFSKSAENTSHKPYVLSKTAAENHILLVLPPLSKKQQIHAMRLLRIEGLQNTPDRASHTQYSFSR